jgi:hypothetical protein
VSGMCNSQKGISSFQLPQTTKEGIRTKYVTGNVEIEFTGIAAERRSLSLDETVD